MILLLSNFIALPAPGGEAADAIRNFHMVHEWLYRGGRPGPKGFENLGALGIRTVVNLERGLFDAEPDVVKIERERAAEAGIRFEHVPMHPLRAPSRRDVERVLALIDDPSARPVFVHCNRGSDRTGIVIAAYRIRRDGWTVREARGELKRYGYRKVLLFWWKYRLAAFTGK